MEVNGVLGEALQKFRDGPALRAWRLARLLSEDPSLNPLEQAIAMLMFGTARARTAGSSINALPALEDARAMFECIDTAQARYMGHLTALNMACMLAKSSLETGGKDMSPYQIHALRSARHIVIGQIKGLADSQWPESTRWAGYAASLAAVCILRYGEFALAQAYARRGIAFLQTYSQDDPGVHTCNASNQGIRDCRQRPPLDILALLYAFQDFTVASAA